MSQLHIHAKKYYNTFAEEIREARTIGLALFNKINTIDSVAKLH